MKLPFAIAACLLLVASPVLARSHHKARVRHSAARGTVVTAGSSVRITNIGEVIGPPNTIIVVSQSPANAGTGKSVIPPKGSKSQP